jgi:hypothetical protein
MNTRNKHVGFGITLEAQILGGPDRKKTDIE